MISKRHFLIYVFQIHIFEFDHNKLMNCNIINQHITHKNSNNYISLGLINDLLISCNNLHKPKSIWTSEIYTVSTARGTYMIELNMVGSKCKKKKDEKKHMYPRTHTIYFYYTEQRTGQMGISIL